MESTRDQIAHEGLRLVMECKVPRFCPTAAGGFNHTVQQQREWAKRLPVSLAPLLDWIEQHRQVLFGGKLSPPPTVAAQDFQKRFLLVWLEQISCTVKVGAFQMRGYDRLQCELQARLLKFSDDVERILTGNAAIRSWLFHYYGSELGLQGWQSRPGDLYGLYYMFSFLKYREYQRLDVLFGQKMLSFLESIGKELLGFKQNSEYQQMGLLMMAIAMEINNDNHNFTNDSEEIFKMALGLERAVIADCCEELWSVFYYSVMSMRAAGRFPDDEFMLDLLVHLKKEITEKEQDPDGAFGDEQLTYLRAVTLLLLLDVPKLDIQDGDFDKVTISDRVCDRTKFRRHVKAHHPRPNQTRFSINIRLRIAEMIPRLFAGFTAKYYVDSNAYKCLDVLTWLLLFPTGQTRQQKNARGLMLKRLLEEMKRLCEGFFKHPALYGYDEHDQLELYASLHPLLTTVREGIDQLPNGGWFRRYRCDMQMRLTTAVFMLELLKSYRQPDEEL